MRNLIKFICVSIGLIASANVFAGDSSSGCGLGWEILPKNSLLSSLLRTTTHAILPNSFSMTFGTSGCAKHSIVQKTKRSLHFVGANKEVLAMEMAQGSGESVDAFAETAGCVSKDLKSAFRSQVKTDFQTIAPAFETSDASVVESVYLSILRSDVLRSGCFAADLT